jgi:hypothetical protein
MALEIFYSPAEALLGISLGAKRIVIDLSCALIGPPNLRSFALEGLSSSFISLGRTQLIIHRQTTVAGEFMCFREPQRHMSSPSQTDPPLASL